MEEGFNWSRANLLRTWGQDGLLDVGGTFTLVNYLGRLGKIARYYYDVTGRRGFDATPVFEPATMLLDGSSLTGLAGFARKKF